MAGKETVRPYFTMSGCNCNVGEGTSSAASDLDISRVRGETREAARHLPDNQAANRNQECHVCRFGFTDTEAFQKHTADHSLGKNHNCSECGKLFVSTETLRRHLLLHGETSFECGLCKKTFYRKDGLKNHMLVWHIGSQD
nr:zinc finger protein 596-like [Dermacentor andersoni]